MQPVSIQSDLLGEEENTQIDSLVELLDWSLFFNLSLRCLLLLHHLLLLLLQNAEVLLDIGEGILKLEIVLKNGEHVQLKLDSDFVQLLPYLALKRRLICGGRWGPLMHILLIRVDLRLLVVYLCCDVLCHCRRHEPVIVSIGHLSCV